MVVCYKNKSKKGRAKYVPLAASLSVVMFKGRDVVLMDKRSDKGVVVLEWIGEGRSCHW